MKKKFLKIICVKACSLITASCFIVTAVGGSLSASDTSLSVNLYDDIFDSMSVVNRQYGMVTSARDSSSTLTIVNIQDLHCHEQTQRNISEIIKTLDKNYSLKSVFVEGGYADIDISWADRIQNEKIKDLIIEKMLQDGYLTGAEYYAIKNRKYNLLKGIEEKDIHEANLGRLAKIIEKQPQYNFVFSKINKEIEVLGNIYLNERNKRFTKKINEYADGQIDTLKFYRLLKKYVKKINEIPQQYNNVISIDLNDYPNISDYIDISGRSKDLNSRQVSLELQTLINAVKNKIPYESYKKLLKITDNFKDVQKLAEFLQQFCKQHAIDLSKDFKELNSFFEAGRLNNKINPVDLVNEERILIGQIRAALSYDNTEYEISYINDFSKYFRQYLSYALNSSDWKYFQENFEKFRFLYSKYAAVDRINELDKEISLLNDYYQTNDIRNNIFVSNILNGQNYEAESGLLRTAEQMLRQSKEVIVVITGGYHSDDLQSIFENRKINSIVITPSVFGDTKNAAKKYDSIIKEQAAVQSNALALKLMECLPDKEQRNLMARVAVEIYGKDNTAQLQQVAGNDFDFSKIEPAEVDEQKKSVVKDLIETTVSSLVSSLPLNAGKDIFNPDIDAVMLNMCVKLYNMGFYFENGAVYEIDSSEYKYKDLLGIPAEAYSRMFAGLQRALFNVEKNRDLKNKLSIFDVLKSKNSVFSFLAKAAPVWEEILFRTIPSLVIIFNPVIGISLFVVSQIAFLFSHTIVKWLFYRDSKGKRLNFAGLLKDDLKNLSFPALAVSVPYILVSILNPLLWPAATASAIMIHYLFNGKLSIFKILKNNRLTNNYEIKIPLDELGVGIGDKVLVTYLHPECLVISRNIEEVNFLFDELSNLNPEKKEIYERLIYPYTFEFTVRRGGVVNIKRLIHCSSAIKSELEKGSNNITFVYKTEPVNVIEEKEPVQSADEQDKTSIVPKRGQNNILSASVLPASHFSDETYRYSASLPRLVPTIDNSPGIASLYRKIFDVATIQTANGKKILKTNRIIENYLSIIKQAENKKFLESLVNNNKNYFKYRLFALMYLRAGGYDVYNADAIQDIKMKFVEALRNNSISVESNFDLRAVLTGVYILLEDFSRQYLETAKEIEIYKSLSKAVVVRRGKSNTAIAKSNMTFVSVDPLTMAHEIGHLILTRASKSSPAQRTLHELFADTIVNLFSKITGLPEQKYQAALYGLFNESVNYNDVFQEEHAASWGFIEMIKDVSSRVSQDASWDILADAIISYTRRLSGRQLYNKTQADNLKEVVLEYIRSLQNNSLYPRNDLIYMFNFVKGITQGETIVMGLLADIKQENPAQYTRLLTQFIEKLKPQKSYSKSRKKTTTYENDRQIINRLVVSQPENIAKVLDIIRSEILKNEFYDKYDFENLIRTELLIKFPNKLYEPAQKIEYEIYSVISAIVGQAVKSDYYRTYGTFSHREYLYAQSYINKIMRKERDFNSYFRKTPGVRLTMTLLDKLPQQTVATFEYPIIVLGIFFPKIRNWFLSEHKKGDISQIETQLAKLENTTGEKIKDVLQIEISSINSLSFIKKIVLLSKILTNKTIKDLNIEEHLKLNKADKSAEQKLPAKTENIKWMLILSISTALLITVVFNPSLISFVFMIFPVTSFFTLGWSLLKTQSDKIYSKEKYESEYFSNIPETDYDYSQASAKEVTVQIPVFQESNDVIFNTIMQSIKACQKYIQKSGARANIVISDDGLAFLLDGDISKDNIANLLQKDIRDLTKNQRRAIERIKFYRANNISFVARPKEKRKGLFKKASNLNHTYRLINTLKNAGIIEDGTYYEGGSLFIGDIILLLDKDSQLHEDVISVTVPKFIKDENLAFTQNSTLPSNENDNYFTRFMALFTTFSFQHNFSANAISGGLVSFVGHNGFIRKKCLEEVEYWPEDRVAEDFYMSVKFQTLGYRGMYLSFKGYEFKEMVSRSYIEEANKILRYVFGLLELIFNRHLMNKKSGVQKGILTDWMKDFLNSGNVRWYQKINFFIYPLSYLNLMSVIPMTLISLLLKKIIITQFSLLFLIFTVPFAMIMYKIYKENRMPDQKKDNVFNVFFKILLNIVSISVMFVSFSYSVLKGLRKFISKKESGFQTTNVDEENYNLKQAFDLMKDHFNKNKSAFLLLVLWGLIVFAVKPVVNAAFIGSLFYITAFSFVSIIFSPFLFKSLKTVFNEKTENINLCFKIYNESNRFSDKRTEAGINEHTVLIVTDMTEFENKYKFINTGLKVNGQTIWQINIDGLLVFGAKDTNIQEIAQALNGSKIIDKKIKEILQLNKKVRLDIDSVIVDEQSEDMFFYGRTAVINTDQYAKTAVKILDSISVMYAQKTIISLANVSNNDLYSALSSGALRKAITVSQFEYLKKEFENSGKDMPAEITELRKQGTEIYVSVPAVDQRYKDFGISGEIADSAVYDYYSRETFEIELIKEKIPLQQLENKIINSDKPLLIEINLLKEIFRTTKDITETYNGLQSLLGSIKIKLGLKDIKIKDMENFAYSMDFSDLPAVDQDEIIISADIDNFSDAIGLEKDNIIRIILEDTKINEDVKKAFLNVIKERILAKTKLFKQNKSKGLKDKKMEILLGKLLFLQYENADKTTLLPEIESFRGSESDMVRKINELYGRSVANNDPRIINTMIELIVMYCQEYGDKEIIAISDINKIDSYRKMLAAA